MEIEIILKQIDDLFLMHKDEKYKEKFQHKFGSEYCVLGVNLKLVKLISGLLVENMRFMDRDRNVSLISGLVVSKTFENKILGYCIWQHSFHLNIELKQDNILDLRPRTTGILNYIFATRILPCYIQNGTVKKKVIINLINSKHLPDQLMCLRAVTVISRESVMPKDITELMLKNKNWVANSEIEKLLEGLFQTFRLPTKL